MVGPYADELGNVLPNAIEGVGVPVDPLAFAGLLGKLLAPNIPQLSYSGYSYQSLFSSTSCVFDC